ncbi:MULTISPECIES: MmpS family transport accessory protein [unclassified Mycobacterium]|uniref:MmpS family transport accessory protein n=1 Tax=unclassified Mycobacterium TaxID=2642494 RepID=UPI000992CBB5|nr:MULTISPECIES: MmpS family transport accessory protein [unclassified Mycobacterium]
MLFSSLKRTWLGLAVLIVLAVAGASVWQVRGRFGAGREPSTAVPGIGSQIVKFNPKNITYEVFGDVRQSGSLNYLDVETLPNQVDITALPWSHTETTVKTAAVASIMVQTDGNYVGCRIKVNGVARSEHTSTAEHAAVSCTVLSA